LTKKKWDILKSQIVTSKRDNKAAAKKISELNEKGSAKNAKAFYKINRIAVGAPIKIGARSQFAYKTKKPHLKK
jgi:hypothetical protein